MRCCVPLAQLYQILPPGTHRAPKTTTSDNILANEEHKNKQAEPQTWKAQPGQPSAQRQTVLRAADKLRGKGGKYTYTFFFKKKNFASSTQINASPRVRAMGFADTNVGKQNEGQAPLAQCDGNRHASKADVPQQRVKVQRVQDGCHNSGYIENRHDDILSLQETALRFKQDNGWKTQSIDAQKRL
jgi:hypothetical protein